MAEIFVLCVVDGESLVEKYPEAKGRQKEDHTWEPIPSNGGNSRKTLTHTEIHPYARMITKQQNVLDHQASDNLIIEARVADMIQWRAISLTDDREFKVEIDGFTSLDLLSDPDHHKDLDYWEAQAVSPGEDWYNVDFVVTTEPGVSDDDRPRYFFHWDPGILVR